VFIRFCEQLGKKQVKKKKKGQDWKNSSDQEEIDVLGNQMWL